MRGMGPIGLVFFLVPAMIFGMFQMYIGFKTTAHVSEVMNLDGGSDEIAEAVAEQTGEISFKIVSTSGRSMDPEGAAPLLAPATFSYKRTAQISTIVDPQTLLKPGESMPRGELRQLMVEARTAHLADAACEKLLATIAGSCGVSTYSARLLASGAEGEAPELAPFIGYYKVEARVLFTPKSPVGTFPDTATVVYNDKDFDLDEWDIPGPDAAAITARLDEVLAAATRACDELKMIHGNCAITDIDFEINDYRLGAIQPSFEVAYFAPMNVAAGLAPVTVE